MQRPARRCAIDPAHELAVLCGRASRLSVCDRCLEPPRQRLDGRSIAQVLEPLARGRADALLLLLDVRHEREKAR
jgi:hypothetical protein